MVSVFALYGVLASTFIVGQYALALVPPLLLVAMRMVQAGVLLLFIQWIRNNQEKQGWQLPPISIVAQLTLIHIFIPYALEFWALQAISPAKAVLLYSLSPFMTALMEFAAHKRRFSKEQLVGLVIGFVGMLPILLTVTPQEFLSEQFLVFSLPELAILASAACGAWGWLLLRKATVTHGASLFTCNGIAMLCAGALSLVLSRLVEVPHSLAMPQVWQLVGLVGFLVLVGNLLFYNMYGWLLRRYSPTLLSFAGLSTPLFAALYQWVLYGQAVSASFWISFVLLTLGLYIFYRNEVLIVE